MKFNILCDSCGREIEIGNQSGLISFDVEYDDKGRKHLSNFSITHKNYAGHECDHRESGWHDLDDVVGKEGLVYWLDLLDPKYNHGEKNKEAQYTTVDLSFVETMYRCLFPGYDEARHYAKNYGYEVLGISREPTVSSKSIKDILQWAKKEGLK